MSRLCVKGLSPAIVEKELKDLFSKRGEVTDVKVLRSKSGKSRQFAFVGFRSDVQAKEAKEYFHNTFLKTSRISVEMAEKANLGDKKKKPSSSSIDKEAKSTTVVDNPSKKKEVDSKKQDEEKTKKKEDRKGSKGGEKGGSGTGGAEQDEFMDLMKSRKEGKFWGNDDSNPSTKKAEVAKSKASLAASLKGFDEEEEDISDSDSDESYMEVTRAVAAKPGASEESDKDDNDDDDDEDEFEKAPSNKRNNLDAFMASLDSKNEDEKDQKKRKKAEEEEDNEDEDEEDEDEEGLEEAMDEEKEKPEGGEGDDTKSTRLFVKNIPFTCTEDELRELFGASGQVRSVHISLHPDTKTSRGIGFVQFEHVQEASGALAELDGSSFQGRVLRVAYAESSRDQHNGDGTIGGSSGGAGDTEWASTQDRWVKNKRVRQDADSGVANAAYTSADAVVESLAATHDVQGSDILDVGEKGGDLAVRLAIGETKVVQDNKAYFSAHGVELSALESALSGGKKADKRSSTTILVKNLPHCPAYDDLEHLFASCGEVMSFLVPPSRTVALVDFVEPSDARKAFQSLAYRRYKHTPLYLEWAPLGLVNDKKAQQLREAKREKEKRKQQGGKAADGAGGKDKESESGGSNTIFLRNLDFDCSEAEVQQHLQSIGVGPEQGLRSIQVPKSKRGDGKSAGFCFVEYSDPSHAASALHKVHQSKLGARVIEAEMSSGGGGGGGGVIGAAAAGDDADTTASSKKKKKKKESAAAAAAIVPGATKLSVRNVAFQATEGELHSLFATFGAVKRVKLPKKMDGTHRGFGFVEFASHKEAIQAMSSLSSTHLYGRHLILQWAKPDSDDK